jgi:hypothetical protein
MEKFEAKVSNGDAKAVRAILADRLQLYVHERTGWFSTIFTVTGPAQLVEQVSKAVKEWREEEMHRKAW